jgi:hypothetical protein
MFWINVPEAPIIAYMKKRIEKRIKILSILGIDRTIVDTIARNSADFVTNLAIVENCPAVVRDKTMIAKSKQFQGSRK